MLEVREALNQVLFELNMDNMNVSKWNVLQCIKTLLQPFAAATSLMSGDTYVTLSDVIPTYFILRDQLESVVQESSVCLCEDGSRSYAQGVSEEVPLFGQPR